MKPKKKKRKIAKQKNMVEASRVSFPEEEELTWLSTLLDAYFIADKGIAIEINKRLKRGDSLACRKGCSSCCHIHFTIPVYPLELIGIYWYSIERLSDTQRDVVKKQLMAFKKKNPCPFLVDGACAIHPVRPLACRHFNVFNKPCKPGEDPYYTRRTDVMFPNEQYKAKALATMLSFHNHDSSVKKQDAIYLMNSVVKNMHDIDWKNLALRMDGKKIS